MEEREARLRQYAVEAHAAGFNCGECVIDALTRAGIVDIPAQAKAMATGFGGGIGQGGAVCGALAAAVMANGYRHGRPNPWAVPEPDRRPQLGERLYRRYNRLFHDFETAHGGVDCRALCARFPDWNGAERREACAVIVANAAALAAKYLEMTPEEAAGLPYGENISGRT